MIFSIIHNRFRSKYWLLFAELVLCFVLSVYAEDTGVIPVLSVENITNANDVSTLFIDGQDLWSATTGGIVRWYLESADYKKFTATDGLNDNWIITGVRDMEGKLFFGSLYGGILVYDGSKWSSITEAEGIPYNHILSLSVDSTNRLWAGFGAAFGNGLGIKDGDVWIFLTESDGLNSNYVTAIVTDLTNGWAGGRKGINRIENNEVIEGYSEQDGLISDLVTDLVYGPGLILWISTTHGISSFQNGVFTNYTMSNGLPSDSVNMLCFDSEDRLWAATQNGLAFFNGNGWISFENNDELWCRETTSMTSDQSGDLYIGFRRGGIQKLHNMKPVHHYLTDDWLPDNYVRRILKDNDKIWFGCASGHVGWFNTREHRIFEPQTGLEPGWINALDIDSYGHVWVGTFGNGLYEFNGSQWTHYTQENGLSCDYISDIFVDGLDIWVATFGGGICHLHEGNWNTIDESDGLPINLTYRIAKETGGAYWFCHDAGVSKFDGGAFTNYTEDDGLVFHRVYEAEIDTCNIKWFGACRGMSRFDGQTFINYLESDGLVHYRVRDIVFDDDGLMWIATGGGLNTFDGSSFKHLTPRQGLAGYETFRLVMNNKTVWSCSEGGITKIKRIPAHPNADPFIMVAGCHFTESDNDNAGIIAVECIPFDPDNDSLTVELYYNKQALGIFLNDEGYDGDTHAFDGIYSIKIPVPVPVTESSHQIQLMISDEYGGSNWWPGMRVE
ncbi:hypothetical protein JW979_04425 [bacterium]|nr:hypothetical protein [candidate division CSSED10-310 bacterium]